MSDTTGTFGGLAQGQVLPAGLSIKAAIGPVCLGFGVVAAGWLVLAIANNASSDKSDPIAVAARPAPYGGLNGTYTFPLVAAPSEDELFREPAPQADTAVAALAPPAADFSFEPVPPRASDPQTAAVDAAPVPTRRRPAFCPCRPARPKGCARTTSFRSASRAVRPRRPSSQPRRSPRIAASSKSSSAASARSRPARRSPMQVRKTAPSAVRRPPPAPRLRCRPRRRPRERSRSKRRPPSTTSRRMW